MNGFCHVIKLQQSYSSRGAICSRALHHRGWGSGHSSRDMFREVKGAMMPIHRHELYLM